MTLYFTQKEQDEFEGSLQKTYFHSNLGCLNSINGLRPGNMLLCIASTGGGKSTWTRTLIRDLLFHEKNNPTVCIWLSEETIEEYRAMFAMGVPSHERLLNTIAYSEQDNPDCTELLFFEWVEMHQPDVLLFDNLTTSKFYEGKGFEKQAQFSTKLKGLIKRTNCAGVIIAHADAQQTNQRGGLLDINNIRGGKTICNLAEFAFLIQTFQTPKQKFSTLRIAKSRSQNVVHDTYLLNFNPITRSYTTDTPIPFERFKQVFSERNKL